MQTRAWESACLDVWPGRVEVVEVDGACARLVRRGPALELVGRRLYEPNDLLWRDEDAARELAHALRRRPLVLHRLLADSPLVHDLSPQVVRPSGASPVLALEGWALPTRRAADLRRARRRAEADGAVEIELLKPQPAEVEAVLARIAAVEDAGWKGDAGTSLARDAERRGFFLAYARRAAEEGILRAAFLRIGAADAATQLAVEWQDAYWLLKIGYDARFARASPGQLLLYELIRNAQETGLDRVELLGAEAPWTQMWTTETRATVSVLVLPRLLSRR